MTTRRKFIQGAVSAAVAAALPGGDGVALYSTSHPEVWTYKDLKFTTEYTYKTYDFATHGTRLHEALQRSMMQTREAVARNILGKAFPEAELRTPFDLAALEEIEIDIPE
jgi:hypothetical protein